MDERSGVAYPGWGMGGVSMVIEYCFPELQGQRDTYEQIVRDLQMDGLVKEGKFLHITMTGHGMVEARDTERGKRFIKYISSPL